MGYDKFRATYKSKVENKELWEILINELENVENIVNLEEICKNMKIVVKKSLINQKGNISIEEDQLIINVDKTDSNRVNRFTIAHELGHAILHFEKLKTGEILESNYIKNVINHTNYEIEANQFAAALLVEDEGFEKNIKDLITRNRAKKSETYVAEVLKEMSTIYDVSELVINNKLKNLGYIQ